jgi:hypothetical protein
MKSIFTILCSFFGLFPFSSFAQLTNGGTNAYFGVDGDTRNNYVKYGTVSGLIPSDDWFSSASSSYNIIDTSNASTYSGQLQANINLAFNKRMSVPLYSKLNGKLWLDAVYGRDYLATNPLFDSTAFTIASKNGDNPTNWAGGVTNIPDKNDLVDVYAHMRRDGTTVHDSLWFFTGVSTVGTSGSRYFDIELYKNSFSYNPSTGTFTTAGTDAGHTQWLFDASGNIIQTGDMIVAVNFSPGTAPVVDVRIWVSSATFTTVTPAYFSFGTNFDGATPAYGYASILSKSGGTAFGSGISNYSATPAQDTTYSTPWGTEQSTKNWGTQYQSLQLIEVGLNLTRIGVDPALYSAMGLNPCQRLFSDIFFKSRSSNSFVSNMQDFVTPLEFTRNPVMDFSLTPDTLRCNRTTGTIQITNNSTIGYYTWQTTTGNITGSNSDSSQINLNKSGTYIVSASPAPGCPATRTDTVVIPIDTFPPVASVMVGIGSGFSYLQFYGGDVTASNYMTPFGGSQGLLWNWSGPDGFASTIQNPTNDTTWGTYQLIVTEKRNGCKDTALKTVNFWDFGVLAARYLILTGGYVNQTIQLNWQDIAENNAGYYEIQKSSDNSEFETIGTVFNVNGNESGTGSYFKFTDPNPDYGDNYYRIKCTSNTGLVLYSNIIKMNDDINGKMKIYLIQGTTDKTVSLACASDKEFSGKIAIYNMTGQLLQSSAVHMNTGLNIIALPAFNKQQNDVLIVSLFVNNQLAFSQKALF